jgi:HEPN domain-containing protein
MKEADLAHRWLKKAEDDLIIAHHAIEKLFPKQLEIACYHYQQAAEKSLKGCLVSCGLTPPKIHDLIQLCKLCCEYNASFAKIQGACEELTLYGVATRYPDNDEVTEADAITARKEAERVFDFCAGLIKTL